MLRLFTAWLGFALLAGPAAAQELDGAWFKMKFKSQAVEASGGFDASGPPKAVVKGTAYMFFELNEPDGEPSGESYRVTIWSEVFPGNWSPGLGIDGLPGTFEFNLQGPDEALLNLTEITVFVPGNGPPPPDGVVLGFDGLMTGVFKLKLKNDELKSASFKTLGGLILDGTADGFTGLAGGFSMRGKTINPNKLPFDLEDL